MEQWVGTAMCFIVNALPVMLAAWKHAISPSNLFVTLVTLDSMYTGLYFLAHHTRNAPKDQAHYASAPLMSYLNMRQVLLNRSKRTLSYVSTLYIGKGSSCIDRCAYYLIVSTVFEAAKVLGIIHSQSFFWMIVILHCPLLFNRYVMFYTGRLLSDINARRHRLIKVALLMNVLDSINIASDRSTHVPARLGNMADGVSMSQIKSFVQNYVTSTVLFFLREYNYYLYKVLKYAWYARTGYAFEPLHYQQASGYLSEIGSDFARHLEEPAFAHNLIFVARCTGLLAMKKTSVMYGVQVWFTVWTMMSFFESAFVGYGAMLFFYFHRPIEVHMCWLLMCCVAHAANVYCIPAAVMVAMDANTFRTVCDVTWSSFVM